MNRIILACFLLFSLAACTEDEPMTGGSDRDKYIGSWNVSSNGSQSGHLTYTMDIVAGNSSPAQVIMKNFDFQGTQTNTVAEVDGNTIAILNNPPQVFGNDTIAGHGTYSNNQITFSYTVRDGITTDVVTATATR
jgi:hypothetical protein